jgi:hypothetical protein
MMGGGGFGQRGSATVRKYSLNFNAQISNLFNDINYANPSGTIVPTFDSATNTYGPGNRFGSSTSLGGGMMGGGGSASRTINFQLSFSF